MNAQCMEAAPKEKGDQMAEQETITYEYEGYQVRVHFTGGKTLAQCVKNLAEREMGG